MSTKDWLEVLGATTSGRSHPFSTLEKGGRDEKQAITNVIMSLKPKESYQLSALMLALVNINNLACLEHQSCNSFQVNITHALICKFRLMRSAHKLITPCIGFKKDTFEQKLTFCLKLLPDFKTEMKKMAK